MGSHPFPDSDIDLALYYHPDQPLDLGSLAQLAQVLDDEHRPNLLTPHWRVGTLDHQRRLVEHSWYRGRFPVP